jgi:hypothetical protein
MPRYIPFAFDLPIGHQPGQELPPTFSNSALVASGTRGRLFAERAEVNYKVTALWEPSDGYENRARQVFNSHVLPVGILNNATGSKSPYCCSRTTASSP